MNYECHITVDTKHAELAAMLAGGGHWKTSEIARDPVLGDKNFFYLTTHMDCVFKMREKMDLMVSSLQYAGIPVLRKKIELIVFDERTPTTVMRRTRGGSDYREVITADSVGVSDV